MSGQRLSVSSAVVLDATGAGTITLGPGSSSATWSVERLTTLGNSTKVPRLRVYRGSTSGPMIESTELGNQDVCTGSPFDLFPGEYVTAAYTGGTPGARMTLYAEGVQL